MNIDLRNNKTNKLLSNALIELLKEKSFEEIKLNEICNKALVHKTTFYNHFQDKYDLLYFVIENMYENLSMNIDSNLDLIDYYIELAKEYIKEIKNNTNFYASILKSNQHGICLDVFHNTVVGNVKEKIEKAENKFPIPSNYIAKYYVSAVFSLVTEWFTNGMKENEDILVNYLQILIKNNYYNKKA